jgi:hypothetical protein
VAGDDWVIRATTADDVSDWDAASLVAEFRRGRYADAPLVASTNDGTASTDLTDPTLGAVPSSFTLSGGLICVVVRRDVTVSVAPGDVFLELSIEAPSLNGRRTIGTFVLSVLPQVAVEAP